MIAKPYWFLVVAACIGRLPGQDAPSDGATLLHGVWTYRSFVSEQKPVGDFNEIRWGQGELVLELASAPGSVRGHLAFRSLDPAAWTEADPRLDVSGEVRSGDPLTIRMRGSGVAKTDAEGWVYDYVGYLAPKWNDGVAQRAALVGTVMRVKPHDGRPAGVVGSFIAVRRDFLEPRDVIPLPNPVLQMLASKEHRLHHTVWHTVRNEWLGGLDEAQRDGIRKLGWGPGHGADRPALGQDYRPLTTNGSGEDFLFMHRAMIEEVGAVLKKNSLAPIKSWGALPAPASIMKLPDFSKSPAETFPSGNPDGYTVPPTWFIPNDEMTNRRIAWLKSDGHYWSRMRWWDREFKNPEYLRTLTLGELGSLLEWSVHNDLHMRWASVPRDPETGEEVPGGRGDYDVRDKWDNAKNDYLGDLYSSHVNPLFWRLHGWVDDRIEDWFNAHQATHPGEVERAVVDGVNWFKKGKWVSDIRPWRGPVATGGGHGHGGGGGGFDVATMTQVLAIISGIPVSEAASINTLTFAERGSRSERVGRRRSWF